MKKVNAKTPENVRGRPLTPVMFPIPLLMYGRLAISEKAKVRTRFGDVLRALRVAYAQDFPRWGLS
ncbi:MAG: hypothetical protein HY853_02165 [Burkholderiales bacterium]|nr:hypothetical protein [Burkholderiales bacterium]